MTQDEAISIIETVCQQADVQVSDVTCDRCENSDSVTSYLKFTLTSELGSKTHQATGWHTLTPEQFEQMIHNTMVDWTDD